MRVFMVFVIIVLLLISIYMMALYCCFILSGRISRDEERMYKEREKRRNKSDSN